MPFVVSPPGTGLEALELDGLHLNSDEIGMTDVAFPPPRQRQEWIGAADSEFQVLVRDPLYENREITANLVVVGGDKDGMLQRVGEIVDKLQKASKYTDGISLVWSPGGSTLDVTFDVLSGEVTDMAVDVEWNLSHVAKLTVVMRAKPFWHGEETLTSTTSSSAPFVTAEIVNAIGDVPALGRLIVTDTATQSRRHVEWGLEGPLTYNASTSLLIDSDDMVTFSGMATTQSGAYDPNASGNSVIASTAYTAATAMAGTGNLSHVGSFRVKARVYDGGSSATVRMRLSWRVGDGPMSSNPWVDHQAGGWRELDLGTVTIPEVVSGTQRWTGQVELLRTSDGATTGVALDYLVLVPVTDGYGKARGTYSYTPGVIVAKDDFTGTTAGVALNGRPANIGGTWATSGSATDLTFEDNFLATGAEFLFRQTASDAGRRFAILDDGVTDFADTEVATNIAYNGLSNVGTYQEQGVIARWVDSINYLTAYFKNEQTSGSIYQKSLVVEQVVAGVTTVLASEVLSTASSSAGASSIPSANAWHTIRLTAFASGQCVASISTGGATVGAISVSSAAVATGGALDDGKPGLMDRSTATGSRNRYYDDWQHATPAAEPIALYSSQSIEFRHDDTVREDSTGTYYGPPPSYRGSRFLVPVGTSRALVKARRNDVDTTTDDNVTDATQIQVGITPRGLVVPRG